MKRKSGVDDDDSLKADKTSNFLTLKTVYIWKCMKETVIILAVYLQMRIATPAVAVRVERAAQEVCEHGISVHHL